jgi:hypothetical protein
VQVHEHASYFPDDTGRAGRAIDPGAAPAFGRDLSTQDNQPIIHIDPAFREQRAKGRQLRGIEDALDYRVTRARTYGVR